MCWTCEKDAPTKPCRGCGVNLPRSFDRCPKCYSPTEFLSDTQTLEEAIKDVPKFWGEVTRQCGNCGKTLAPDEHHVANPGYFPEKNIKCFVLLDLGTMTNEPIKFTKEAQ